MFEKLNDLRERAGAFLREHREQAAQRKEEMRDPPGVTVPEWLVRAAHFASWIAMASLVYFLWLYTLDIARDRAGAMHLTHAGSWIGDLQFWFPYIVGFAIVSFGIPYTAKIAIPTFMSLTWRGAGWAKAWALFIAVCVSCVVIFGTFVIQGDTLLERDRDAAVAVATVNNGRTALETQIQGITDDLRASTEGNSTQAQAARVGMLAGSATAARQQWQSAYVAPALASGDVNAERIRRAAGSAEAAGAAVERREALRRQLAQAPVAASAQEASTIQGGRNGWVGDLIGRIEGIRAILLSFVMDIVALMMPWIALRLEQARNAQLGMAGGIPKHRWMINDMTAKAEEGAEAPREGSLSREEFVRRTAPMDASYKGDLIYDEQGNELGWVEGFVRPKDGKWIPGHYRKTGNRQRQEIEVTVAGRTFKTEGSQGEVPVTQDGGNRIGTKGEHEPLVVGPQQEDVAADPIVEQPTEPVATEEPQPDPSSETDDAVADAFGEMELASQDEPSTHEASDSAEPAEQETGGFVVADAVPEEGAVGEATADEQEGPPDHDEPSQPEADEPQQEPITDERRLIAAE